MNEIEARKKASRILYLMRDGTYIEFPIHTQILRDPTIAEIIYKEALKAEECQAYDFARLLCDKQRLKSLKWGKYIFEDGSAIQFHSENKTFEIGSEDDE